MRWAALLSLATAIALTPLAPALADPASDRPFGWEIHARPRTSAEPSLAVVRGEQHLPDISWADVYLPRSYDPAHPAPMAVLLHGSGDRGRTMIEAFADLAEQHGVILLAIDSEAYSWDIMVKGARLRNTTHIPKWGDDVGRIDQALARAFDLYAVDPKRIALIGFSDGAGYGLSLGANNADLFPTVIAFAPGLLTRVDGNGRGRVFIAHGEQDRTLPVGPSRDIFAPALKQLSFGVTLRLFQGRHEMPETIRAEAFAWWLRPDTPVDHHATAR